MLPGRTDNEIKNLWNTHIKKKLVKMGVDPVTHKPLDKQANSVSSQSTATTESKSDRPLQSRGTDGQIQSSENTSSPTETSSNTDGADPLLSCLWEDNTSLLDELWQFPSNEDVDYSSVAGQIDPVMYKTAHIKGMEQAAQHKKEGFPPPAKCFRVVNKQTIMRCRSLDSTLLVYRDGTLGEGFSSQRERWEKLQPEVQSTHTMVRLDKDKKKKKKKKKKSCLL
ncbi:hypothetical protein B296_00001073 [Ensete ventricosum]|uniref:HTH myb-type domain-containing protein n=1 Tax=Ensete ventricosum TaxID=4639 RepID=A0A427AVJ8_ENSVE|nr:hypothetical protein B296_00001073 [Ensete ventricosum]